MIEVYERWADVEIARKDKTRHLRKENEITFSELEWSNAVRLKKARAIEKEAEGWILVPRFSNAPGSSSAYDL